jgi:hypothetical protein
LAWWLQSKRNFVWFSLLTVGVGVGVVILWNFHDLIPHPLWYAFLGVDGLLVGLLWGVGMWHLFVLPKTAALRPRPPNSTQHSAAHAEGAPVEESTVRAGERGR